MREEPDPAVLSPEVTAQGSLAAALQAAAAAQGLSLTMTVTPDDLLRQATMPSVLPHREALFVAGWKFERQWSVSGWANNGPLIDGTTADLHQLPKVVLGWAQGASLDEIAQAAPFDVLTGRLEVPDGNPADVIAAEWQYLLKDARPARCWPGSPHPPRRSPWPWTESRKATDGQLEGDRAGAPRRLKCCDA